MNIITSEQNNYNNIHLLKAQRVAYSEAKRIQNFEWIVQAISLVTPIIGILALPTQYDKYALLIGLLFSTINVATYINGKRKTDEGANIQEQFDVALFKISWDSFLCGDKIPTNRIIQLSNEYLDSDMNNWYSSEIHGRLNQNTAVLLCQNSNLTWDNDLRKRFLNHLLFFLISYYSIFIVYLIYKNTSFLDSILLLSPTLSFLYFSIINISNQNDTIRDKESLIVKIQSLFDNIKNTQSIPAEAELRAIQNIIYACRKKPEKIPDWYYRIKKDKFETSIDECVKFNIRNYNLI